MACLPYYKGISFPLNIFFFLINIICSLVSIIGNSLTIFSIKTKPQLQSPSNWLLAGLSLTDLLAGVIAQPMYGTYLAFFDYKNNCVLEKSIVFMSATSCSTSLLHLCVIARDRYVHISKAMHSNEYDSGVKVCMIDLPLGLDSGSREVSFLFWLAYVAAVVIFPLFFLNLKLLLILNLKLPGWRGKSETEWRFSLTLIF